MTRAWENAKPLIEAALKYQDTHSITDVERELANDRAQLWCGDKSAIVTQMEDYPAGKKVRVWLAGGELNELLEMLPDIEAWAAEQKCLSVVIAGRHGWARVLKDYTQPYAYLERKIDHG